MINPRLVALNLQRQIKQEVIELSEIIKLDIMLKEEKLTLKQKIIKIHEFKQQIPAFYQSSIPQQVPSKQQPSVNHPKQFIDAIRINSFYKAVSPMIDSLFWKLSNHEVLYPIVAIVAFYIQEEQYQMVKLKFANWVQSGGTRCIPIKCSWSQQKIVSVLSHTHGLVIPSPINNKGLQQFIQKIIDIMSSGSQWNSYPVLVMGTSGLIFLNKYIGKLKGTDKCNLASNNQPLNDLYTVFVSHQSQQTKLFQGLDLSTRMVVENRRKISMFQNSKLNPAQVSELLQQNAKITGVAQSKSGQIFTLSIQFTKKMIYLCFFDPCPYSNVGHQAQAITFCHKVISNFLDSVRMNNKNIEQKPFLATNKLIVGSSLDQSHYKLN